MTPFRFITLRIVSPGFENQFEVAARQSLAFRNRHELDAFNTGPVDPSIAVHPVMLVHGHEGGRVPRADVDRKGPRAIYHHFIPKKVMPFRSIVERLRIGEHRHEVVGVCSPEALLGKFKPEAAIHEIGIVIRNVHRVRTHPSGSIERMPTQTCPALDGMISLIVAAPILSASKPASRVSCLAEVVSGAQRHVIRTICDNYLHVARRNGEYSPHQSFLAAISKQRLMPMPRPLVRTIALGVEDRKVIGPHGIEYAGMFYDSPVVQSIRQDTAGAVTFKYDPWGMREIYVLHNGDWHVAPAVFELPHDVSIVELLAVRKALANAWPEIAPEAFRESLNALRGAA